MSLAELKTETAALSPSEQKELAAFLTVLRMKQSSEWEEALRADTTAEARGWVTLEDAKMQLGELP